MQVGSVFDFVVLNSVCLKVERYPWPARGLHTGVHRRGSQLGDNILCRRRRSRRRWMQVGSVFDFVVLNSVCLKVERYPWPARGLHTGVHRRGSQLGDNTLTFKARPEFVPRRRIGTRRGAKPLRGVSPDAGLGGLMPLGWGPGGFASSEPVRWINGNAGSI